MNELAQNPAESALSWLTRLAAVDAGPLTLAERRALVAYRAEARRLCQEGRQVAKWGRDRR